MLPAQEASRSQFKWAGVEDNPVQKLARNGRALPKFAARITTVRTLLGCIALAALGVLFWFSLKISAMRIFQVDECTEVYVAKVLTLGRERIAGLQDIGLFQVFLSWVVASGHRAMELFVSARFVMLEIFWLNIALMAVATGEKLFSLRGLAALLGAATLAPLWDYGLEIRHDNPFLTGMLLIWCTLRVRPGGLQSYFVAGALVVLMQFVAFKAFAYTVPISIVALLFPPPGHNAPRWKLWVGWLAGALAAFIAVRIWYGALGLWAAYRSGFGLLSAASTGRIHFGAGTALKRLPGQTPLLLAMTVAAVVGAGSELWQRARKINRLRVRIAGSPSPLRERVLQEPMSRMDGLWDGNLPEAMLFFVAFGALLINPTPFPYNLLHLVPYAYILGFRHCASMWRELSAKPAAVPALGAVLVFTHFVPFGVATYRHLDWTNSRQEGLMRLAEDLTDPEKDPVYDATGMVPTRPIVHPQSFIHSFTIKRLNEGPGARFHQMLAENPAAVLMPNYRTDALLPEDHAYIGEHYVALADDFWVLGMVLPSGGGAFEIIHPGRYRVSTLAGSDLAGTFPEGLKSITTPEEQGNLVGKLDGLALSGQMIELAAGIHHIETSPDCQPSVVWVGPRLERIHRLQQRDHRLLFVNWY